MRALTGRRVLVAAGLLTALLATGCSCGKKGPRTAKGSSTEVMMRDDAILMRLDQMQAEMDNRFAAVDYRLSQQPVASTTYVSPTPAPAPITYTESSVTTAYPAAGMPSSEPYYAPAEQISTAMTTYNDREWRAPAPARSVKSPAPSSGSVIRVPGVTTRDVQIALRDAGHNPGAVDGKMGAKTKSAIMSFQRANGLKADGIVGRRTWDSLMAFLPATGGGAGNFYPVIHK